MVCLCLPLQGQATAVAEWKDDPYRNFLGYWTGKIVVNPDKLPTDVFITVTEEKAKARMRWDYIFGHPGEKKFERISKFIVLSPTDAKMLMHFGLESERLFDTPGLAAFAQAGFGTLVASETSNQQNYWHVKHVVVNRVAVTLQPETLSYVWEIVSGGKTKVYSAFEFKRSAATMAPANGMQEK